MADLVLRVRLLAGDQIDVIYAGRPEADPEQALADVVATLADDSGALRVRHGDRTLVLFARGVALVEIAPRGAVL
jgi:hypothetical protein